MEFIFSKANEYLQNTKYIDQIIPLLRNNKNLEHDGIIGFFKLANKLRKYNFDSIFIFNSSTRFNLIAKIAGIKNIYQYPMFNKKNQHIIKTAQKFLKKGFTMVLKKPGVLFNKNLNAHGKFFKMYNKSTDSGPSDFNSIEGISFKSEGELTGILA